MCETMYCYHSLVLITLGALIVLGILGAICDHRKYSYVVRSDSKKPVPVYGSANPNKSASTTYLLPGRKVRIWWTRSYLRTKDGFVIYEGVKSLDNDRYLVTAKFGVHILDGEGEETGRYYPHGEIITVTEMIKFGNIIFSAYKESWVDMADLTPVYGKKTSERMEGPGETEF